jgi:hypothetical protein
MGGKLHMLGAHSLISTELVWTRQSREPDLDNAANFKTVCRVLLNISVHTAEVCTLSRQKELLQKTPTKHPLHPLHNVIKNPLKEKSDISSIAFNTNWTHSPTFPQSDMKQQPTFLPGVPTSLVAGPEG